jgi:putative flippase GtrA
MKYNTKRVAKFLIVGIINTAINLVVLNLLILITSRGRSGTWFTIYQTIGFIFATINSYLLNKYWTFEHANDKTASEYTIFFFVSFIGLLLNVGSASLLINATHKYFITDSLEEKLMPSLASLFGTVVSWLWNYNGYKRIFHKKI